MLKYFFINTYDLISAALLHELLNSHEQVKCLFNYSNPLTAAANDQIIDDIIAERQINNIVCGDITSLGSCKLYENSLKQKTKTPFRRINITAHPELRLKLILREWSKYDNNQIISLIQKRLQQNYFKKNDSLKNVYTINYFIDEIKNHAHSIHINNDDATLLIYALALIAAYDCTDYPIPGPTFSLESLISSEEAILNLLKCIIPSNKKLASAGQYLSTISKHVDEINEINNMSLLSWQQDLLNFVINKKFNSIHYIHSNKRLIDLYQEKGYSFAPKNTTAANFKLLSIQLNSNRPAQLSAFFDNIEETCSKPDEIEVIVNIDEGDDGILNLLKNEISYRKFTIKYCTSAKPTSFCDLWQPLNTVYKLTDPSAYFLVNISDEMFFACHGWDNALRKYVDLYPDGFFRLRASRNKIRAYFDRWECSFAQDSIPITTKKWISVGGDWNPCFGPDSFQQLVSYYLSKEGQYSNTLYLRDVPVFDIPFNGDIPFLGINNNNMWQHNKDHINAMLVCQSHPMQEEAKRRALLIKANIIAHNKNDNNLLIRCNSKYKRIEICNKTNGRTIESYSYRLSKTRISLTNNIRKMYFFAYFGGGEPKFFLFSGIHFLRYLKAQYAFVSYIFDCMNFVRYIIRCKQLRKKVANRLGIKLTDMLIFCKKLIKGETSINDMRLKLKAKKIKALKHLCRTLKAENKELARYKNQSPAHHDIDEEPQTYGR